MCYIKLKEREVSKLENNEKRLKQIDISIIAVIILIFVLIHSIYLLISEKKGLLGEETLSEEQFIVQVIWNRLTAAGVVLIFLIFSISSLNDLLNSEDTSEEQIKDQLFRVIALALALVSILIELFLGFKNYIALKNQ